MPNSTMTWGGGGGGSVIQKLKIAQCKLGLFVQKKSPANKKIHISAFNHCSCSISGCMPNLAMIKIIKQRLNSENLCQMCIDLFHSVVCEIYEKSEN